MVSRRGWRALVLSVLLTALLAVPLTYSGAVSVVNANENARTLVLSLPGPFNGCSFLDPGADQTSDAILDLIRPSAFTTQANGVLVGEGGPITSAELTSLQPETVRYTIAPRQTWSNGFSFTGADLIAWWQRAKHLASVTSDGYRAIKSLTLSPNKLSVTAVFSQPFADWDLLFRDVEASGTPEGCAVSNLVTRPSLGPYKVVNASASRVVLVMNSSWPLDTLRFGRIVLTDAATWPKPTTSVYAHYSLSVSPSAVQSLSATPNLLSRISSSSDVEELTFAPNSSVTSSRAVREALSWAVQRQNIIDQIFGSVTFSPSVAASAIYSQGQSQYPGTAGTNPVGQATTTTIDNANGLSDCLECAVDILKDSGYRRFGSGWVSPSGVRLRVRLAVGPSVLDQTVAAIVKSDWTTLGVVTTFKEVPTETLAARASASSKSDVALFARPTATTPAFAARSWAGPAYPDTFPSGVRLPNVTALFNRATQIFNPVTASSDWLQLDQVIMSAYWVRPIFTAPSLVVWSSSLVTVQNSFTVAGFVDQVPTWSLTPPPT